MSTRLSHRWIWLVGILAAALVLSACGKEEEEPDAPAGGSETTDCEKDSLPLLEEGQLTIATDSPAYPPWFQGNDPTNGKGYESAVAYAVAEEMGFAQDEVEWVVEPFNKSYAPGP